MVISISVAREAATVPDQIIDCLQSGLVGGSYFNAKLLECSCLELIFNNKFHVKVVSDVLW